MKTSWSDRPAYRDIVAEFVRDERKFDNFRTSSFDYNVVLEHTTYEQGLECFEYVKSSKHLPTWRTIALINDSIGKPALHRFDDITASPSTIRYLRIAHSMADVLEGVSDPTIVEVGGGYGGLAAVATQALGCREYTIYDLPECGDLQRKFISRLPIPDVLQTACTCDADPLAHPVDLFVSTWAFNELTKDEARKYSRTIANARHGYVVGLWIGGDSLSYEEWIEMAPRHATHREYKPTTGFNCIETRW